jgi:uncharacterized linocin/CFP29 family protein
MDSDTSPLQWTEEQWNLVQQTVRDEARKVRIAASFLPVHGPLPPDAQVAPLQEIKNEATADSGYSLRPGAPPEYSALRQRGEPEERLSVDDLQTRPLTTVFVNVYLKRAQVAQPDLSSALIMFRRAANIIARVEDTLVFAGQTGPNPPPGDIEVEPHIFRVTGGEKFDGLVKTAKDEKNTVETPTEGEHLVTAVVQGIAKLEKFGHLAPFALVLGPDLFVTAYKPERNSMVLPADRIKPLLDGPLLRSSTIDNKEGVLVSLAGELIDLLVASDISVRLVQETLEPRYVCRVSQRFTLRIKDKKSIVALVPPSPSPGAARKRGRQ